MCSFNVIKLFQMYRAGIILIIIGILLIILPGIMIPVQENLVKVGPLGINQTRHDYFGWPNYIGIIVLLGGVVMILLNKKK
ncbi:MAG: hypothetical protein NVS3B19_06770 [Ginsengibacter sp.]